MPHPAASSTSAASAPSVTVSQELMAPVSREIELCYQTFGSTDDEPLVLVMGLGGPMTWWDDVWCAQLAQAGFYVVRFDNRDVGRSSRATGKVTRRMLVRAFAGVPTKAPYPLSAMADDTVALMDHLGLDSAHLVGVSMGGMIVQTVAINAPTRVRSLTSIMSTTGRRTVGWQHPSLIQNLLGRTSGRDGYIKASVATWQRIGSPAYPLGLEETVRKAGETYDRGVSFAGLTRQMAAIITQPDRTAALHALRMPTLVIHGLADKMVHVSGGRATANAIRGSELLLIDGMGHDLPKPLYETFTRAIRAVAERASSAPSDQTQARVTPNQ